MPTFSLLVPTRERIVELTRLLRSLYLTVTNKADVEILLAIDNDDALTKNYLPNLITQFEMFKIRPFYRDSSGEFVFINRDYYNWLAEQAEGKYLWISADDITYEVIGWDVIIPRYIEGYLNDRPDRIMCAGIKDNTPKPSPHLPPFPCFPLITRETFKHLGFILHPFVPTWGADYLLYLLYTGVNRYLVIDNEVYINHISYHTRQCVADKITERIGHTFNRLKMRPEYNIDRHAGETLPTQIEELKNYITYWRPDERVE